MSRRAKLDLSASKDHDKQQAEGFEATDLEPAETEQAVAEAQPETPERAEYEPRESAVDLPSAPRGKQLVKVLVVVAVTALALYLLKRRFL